MENLIASFVEVKLAEPDDFRKVRETLTRIGIAPMNKKELYQSCHILHKKGKFYIVHFKEMFMLDGQETTFSENDIARRNTIANLLHDWELVDLVDESKTEAPTVSLQKIKILPYKEKKDWQLFSKYTIGKISKNNNKTVEE